MSISTIATIGQVMIVLSFAALPFLSLCMQMIWLFGEQLAGTVDPACFRYVLLLCELMDAFSWKTIIEYEDFSAIVYPFFMVKRKRKHGYMWSLFLYVCPRCLPCKSWQLVCLIFLIWKVLFLQYRTMATFGLVEKCALFRDSWVTMHSNPMNFAEV